MSIVCNQTILITGGTGSLGSRIARKLIAEDVGHVVIVFSRDEQKQFKMRLEYESNIAAANSASPVKFVIGDVRDPIALRRAFDFYHPDAVIHTAAQKHVRVCDENPEQAIMTNILGTSNVIDACISHKVRHACIVSTDKAVNPVTLYGMTKAIAERIALNAVARQESTTFVGVRYGNVIDSAGSLIPLFQSIAQKPKAERIFTVTHKAMTRFFITFDEAISLIFQTMLYDGNEPFIECPPIKIHRVDNIFAIPALQSAKILDLANIFASKYGGKVVISKPYPSEKIHEMMDEDYSSKDHVMSRASLKTFLNKQGLLP